MTRKNRDRSNLAAALTNVAAYALTVGDVAQAERCRSRGAATSCAIWEDAQHDVRAAAHGDDAARRGDHVRAARLLGASNELYREFGLTREFTERSLYDGTLEELRTALGAGELERHLAAGAVLTLDEAVTEALSTH